MHRTRRLLAFLFLICSALQAGAQAIPLGELSRYLNSLNTVRASFTQINADGTLSTGTVYINRPGRVRFEYDPPEDSLVMATGGQVAVFDPKSNQPPTHYPLRSTPLSIILAENVDLTQARMVTGHDSDGTSTFVTAQDPERPRNGSIRLVFTADPVELRQWVVTDDGGRQTTVVLSEMKTDVQFPRDIFDIVAETRRRGN